MSSVILGWMDMTKYHRLYCSRKNDDKLKLTKVVKFLRVYGYLMGFIFHCISNIQPNAQRTVEAQLICVGINIYGIRE